MSAPGASSVCRTDVDSELTHARASAPTNQQIVGIVAALPAEARCLARSHVAVGASCIVNAHVRLHVGGVGGAAARHAAEALVASGAHALVSWGMAAGLDATLAPGTLVLSNRVVATPRTEHTRDPLDGQNLEERVSSAWADRLSTRLGGTLSVVRGTIACPDGVLRTAEDKRALGMAAGAIAADMETAAIAAVAIQARVPWLAIRVVVDSVDVLVPASVAAAVDPAGHVQMTRLVGALVRHPSDLVYLPALARAYRRALRTLQIVARVADAALLIPDEKADGLRVGRDAGATGRRR